MGSELRGAEQFPESHLSPYQFGLRFSNPCLLPLSGPGWPTATASILSPLLGITWVFTQSSAPPFLVSRPFPWGFGLQENAMNKQGHVQGRDANMGFVADNY